MHLQICVHLEKISFELFVSSTAMSILFIISTRYWLTRIYLLLSSIPERQFITFGERHNRLMEVGHRNRLPPGHHNHLLPGHHNHLLPGHHSRRMPGLHHNRRMPGQNHNHHRQLAVRHRMNMLPNHAGQFPHRLAQGYNQ
jgi:hypothetical protein